VLTGAEVDRIGLPARFAIEVGPVGAMLEAFADRR
jgi:hypothetical protein